MRLSRNSFAKQYQDSELKQISLPENDLISLPSSSESTIVQKNYIYEEELIRIMISFGSREIEFEDKFNLKETNKTTIVEWLCNELIEDELVFEYPLYKKIHSLILDGLKDKTVYSPTYFKRLEDQEIVVFVSDIESREIDLSINWISKYNIFTKSESDDIYLTAMNVLYNFKYNKVDNHLLSLKLRIKNDNLSEEDVLLALKEQMVYELVKKKLSDKLGRIILK